MPGTIRKVLYALIALAVAAAIGGCATGDKRVNVLYEPQALVKGGLGDLYIVQGVRHHTGEAAAIEWVLGRVTKKSGEEVGRVVTDIAPANMVLDALTQELKGAGYNVMVSDNLPEQAKALNLTDVSMRIEETHSFFKDQADCDVKMSVQPWKNGRALTTLSYQADYSDTAVTGRDRLPSESLQKTLQLLMSRAVPAIVKSLEQK